MAILVVIPPLVDAGGAEYRKVKPIKMLDNLHYVGQRHAFALTLGFVASIMESELGILAHT